MLPIFYLYKSLGVFPLLLFLIFVLIQINVPFITFHDLYKIKKNVKNKQDLLIIYINNNKIE